MVKKKEKILEDHTEVSSNQYEKLRDELFQYRVDIKSFQRSMRIVWVSITIGFALLGYLGYGQVEDLLDRVEKKANDRLAKTDSLLAKVDTRYLDSLIAVVNEKTIAYEASVAALEKGTRVNNNMIRSLISGLPYNKRFDVKHTPFIVTDAINMFDIIYYTDDYVFGETGDCYVVMGEEYKKEEGDIFLVEVKVENRRVAVFYQTFEALENYNKLHYSFGSYEHETRYSLVIALIRKRGEDFIAYSQTKPIVVK